MNRTAIREVADLYFERFEARLDKGLGDSRAELRTEIAGLRGELANTRAELRVEFKSDFGNVRAEIIKWMFVFWASTIVPLVGLFIAVLRL